jgi:hypothetical protein
MVLLRSRYSSVGVAISYKLDGRRSIPGWGNKFLFTIHVQTSVAPHPAPYPTDNIGVFPLNNMAGVWSPAEKWKEYTSNILNMHEQLLIKIGRKDYDSDKIVYPRCFGTKLCREYNLSMIFQDKVLNRI